MSNNRPNWYLLIRLFKNNCIVFTTISDKRIYEFDLSFPDILGENPLDNNEEYVSYDVDSQFTCIPLGEIIYFIFYNIRYVRKKLEPFCKKPVPRKLLNKLCKGLYFLEDGRLSWMFNGWPDFSCSFQYILCKHEIRCSKTIKILLVFT